LQNTFVLPSRPLRINRIRYRPTTTILLMGFAFFRLGMRPRFTIPINAGIVSSEDFSTARSRSAAKTSSSPRRPRRPRRSSAIFPSFVATSILRLLRGERYPKLARFQEMDLQQIQVEGGRNLDGIFTGDAFHNQTPSRSF